jgi:hypothetical protein
MKCLNLNARQENTKQVIFLEFSQKNYVVSNKRGFCKDQNNIFQFVNSLLLVLFPKNTKIFFEQPLCANSYLCIKAKKCIFFVRV